MFPEKQKEKTEDHKTIREVILTPNTLIPIGVCGVIIGGTVWLTTIWLNGLQNTNDIVRLRTQYEQMQSQVLNISDKTSRIETKTDILLERVK